MEHVEMWRNPIQGMVRGSRGKNGCVLFDEHYSTGVLECKLFWVKFGERFKILRFRARLGRGRVLQGGAKGAEVEPARIPCAVLDVIGCVGCYRQTL